MPHRPYCSSHSCLLSCGTCKFPPRRPLSPAQNAFPPVVWDKQCQECVPESSSQGVRPEVPTGTLTQPLRHPSPPPRHRPPLMRVTARAWLAISQTTAPIVFGVQK